MKACRTKSRAILLVLACASALQMSPVVAASRSAEEDAASRTLRVTKDCSPPVLAPGELGYCTITASNFRPLRNAKVRYYGPGFFIPPDHKFLDSWVVIESDHGGGGTAFGHCLVRGVPDVLGACQFTGGSGSLEGFKANVTVTVAMDGSWHWNGSMSGNR